MRGVRPMLQALEDDSWIDDPVLAPAVEALLAGNLVFDALVYTRHLPHLRRFAPRHPALFIVLDHAAKPPIGAGNIALWRVEMSAVAALPNIYCKLSGLVTEARPDQGLEDLRPWVDELLTLFGPERLMWGSDWPVVNLASGYANWLALTRQLLASLSEGDRNAILAGTARKAYRLTF